MAKHLIEKTVLDLCDETYYDALGFKAYDLFKTEGGPRVATIACINATRADNDKVHDMLLDDYLIFEVPPFDANMALKDIFDVSFALDRPVMARVDCYGERCVILAANQQPWADWFASLFLAGNETLHDQLEPLITDVLARLRLARGVIENGASGEK